MDHGRSTAQSSLAEGAEVAPSVQALGDERHWIGGSPESARGSGQGADRQPYRSVRSPIDKERLLPSDRVTHKRPVGESLSIRLVDHRDHLNRLVDPQWTQVGNQPTSISRDHRMTGARTTVRRAIALDGEAAAGLYSPAEDLGGGEGPQRRPVSEKDRPLVALKSSRPHLLIAARQRHACPVVRQRPLRQHRSGPQHHGPMMRPAMHTSRTRTCGHAALDSVTHESLGAGVRGSTRRLGRRWLLGGGPGDRGGGRFLRSGGRGRSGG
jgi:hypothetical protein